MCDWCKNLKHALEEINKYDYCGHSIGNLIKFKPWDEKDTIIIQLWYDKEHGMKKRDFLMELSYSENNDGSSNRLVAPIKYCPNCGNKLGK